jgi:hypothetical protein
MPRQNYLSRESFVDITEKQTKEAILSIPAFAPNIKLLAENKLFESIKFTYEQPVKKHNYHINVSVLPLNEKYTRISLHATFANGQTFNASSEMAIVLHDFEAAIKAAIKGDISEYRPYQPNEPSTRKIKQLINNIRSSVSLLFLKKKLS